MKACPDHGAMETRKTRFGRLWVCDAPGCTVQCWDGPTSTPADALTRHLRHRLHARFDPMWESQDGLFSEGRGKGRSARRRRAYRWLALQLGLSRDKCHFGMFDKEMCERAKRVIDQIDGLTTPMRVPPWLHQVKAAAADAAESEE